MAIGEALREARRSRGLTQREVASQIPVSDSWFSDVENGKQRVRRDMARLLSSKLDDPRLYLEAAAEATGGVLVGPWLDGERADLHRASVRAKCIEEMTEAIEALARATVMVNARSREHLDEEAARQMHQALHELIEAGTAVQVAVAVLCRTYSFSPAALYKEHHRELQAKGYVRKAR